MGRPDDIGLSFNEAAEIYDEVRPSYPVELFDALFEALPPQPEIVEVGPGTGQATKDLLARGATVHAIETVRLWQPSCGRSSRTIVSV
jgi:hypothetical protein